MAARSGEVGGGGGAIQLGGDDRCEDQGEGIVEAVRWAFLFFGPVHFWFLRISGTPHLALIGAAVIRLLF